MLATGPRLMLLDEALAGLTPAELQQAIALVSKIHETGVTLVIVEHIMEVIMTLAQRVMVFNQGHVIAQGKPDDVVKDEAVIEAYLGRGHRQWRKKDWAVDRLRVEHLEVRYGDLVGVADVSLDVQPGIDRGAARLERRGQDHDAQLHRRAGAPERRHASNGAARRSAGSRPMRSSRKGLALSPEGWRLFVTQTVEQNLRLGATVLDRQGPDRSACSSASMRCFRASPSGASSLPARCRAASGRCWRSAAR